MASSGHSVMATEAIAEDQTKRVSEGGTCDEFGFRIEEQHVAAFKRHQLAQAETRQAMREQWGLLVAELNLGQLATVLRSTYLLDVHSYAKIQGQPFKVSELLARIQTLAG